MLINGMGALVSGVMTTIIGAVTFSSGACAILLALPAARAGLLWVNAHYPDSGRFLRDPKHFYLY